MTRGKFVTIEGCEGAGKSTQVRLLCEWPDGIGMDYVFIRESGRLAWIEHCVVCDIMGKNRRADSCVAPE